MTDDYSSPEALQTARQLPRGAEIHFIGIGGSSMSGLARLALHAGYRVSGSDRQDSAALAELRALGARIQIGQSAEHITKEIALVIYTVAIAPDDPELTAAIRAGIPVLERGKYLGVLTARHRYSIAVSGTHGKTTTTAMIGSVLLAAGKDPGMHLGGVFPQIGGNVRPSDSEYFVTEACEYHAHMLHLAPYAAVLLNVEAEHLDFYKDLDEIRAAFCTFLSHCPPDGFAVACAEDPTALSVLQTAPCRRITYAIAAPADYTARNIRYADGHTDFDWYTYGKNGPVQRGIVRLSVPGRHNVLNALAAIAVCDTLGCASPGAADTCHIVHL